MSIEAVSWALAQSISPSSAKFVLVVLGNCANGDSRLAHPSVAHLAEATGQDRKTVIAGLHKLREMGFIEDTGERRGTTGQVVVYRLKNPESGTAEQSQIGNSSESGTVPNIPPKSPGFPREQSRFSAKGSQKRDTEPSEPSRNQKGTEKKRASAPALDQSVADLLTDADPAVVRDWLALRKAKRAPVTATVAQHAIAEAAKAGLTITAFLRIWCARGSQGLEAAWLKPHERAQAPPGRHSAAADLRGIDYGTTRDEDIPAHLRPRDQDHAAA